MNTRIAGVGRLVLSSVLCLMVAMPPSLWAGERDLQVVELRERATLWVLTVGVSKYADDRIDLQYADNDAVAIARLLAAQTGRLFREVHTHVLVNENATRVAVLRAMSEFLGQASSEDVVVIFLAGHGLQDRATGTYYFVPFDANNENLLYAGLPMSMFNEAVQRLRRNVSKIVLWLDTCHAGAMNVSATRGVNAGEDLAEALSAASGDYVLSASKAGEESLEDASWELDGEAHGAFTYSLLKGLSGAAADSNGVVWLSDLFGHVSREVPRLTRGQQHPHGDFRGTNLPLMVIGESVQIVIGESVQPQGLQSRPQAESVTVPTAQTPTVQSGGGGKKWIWALLGLAVVGGAAGVTLGGGPAAGTIPPPPDHP